MNNFQNLKYVWVPEEIGFDCLMRNSVDGARYLGHGPTAESTLGEFILHLLEQETTSGLIFLD